MADIGEAVGMRGPSLYKHVQSKQDLLARIGRHHGAPVGAHQVSAWYRESGEHSEDDVVWQYGEFALRLAGARAAG